jgi:hypothetical protein
MQWVPLPNDPVSMGDPPPVDDLIAEEIRQRRRAWVEGLASCQHRTILDGVFVRGLSLDEVAAELEMQATNRAFRQLVEQAIGLVPVDLL